MAHMGIDAVAEPNLHHDHMYVDSWGRTRTTWRC